MIIYKVTCYKIHYCHDHRKFVPLLIYLYIDPNKIYLKKNSYFLKMVLIPLISKTTIIYHVIIFNIRIKRNKYIKFESRKQPNIKRYY